MKMSKAKKRTICGFLGVALACAVFFCDAITNVMDVQAEMKVLDGITEKFTKDKKPVKILEIVPTADSYNVTFGSGNKRVTNEINKNAELGYFMPFSNKNDLADYESTNDNSPLSIGFASKGGVHGDPTTSSAGAEGTEVFDAYKEMLIKYRQYGLVMASGVDRGWFLNVGDYPIFADNAIFSTSYNPKTPYVLPDTLVKGVYSMSQSGSGGNYYIDNTQYTINENGEICRKSSVSANGTVSRNTVSMNTPVEDIDLEARQLPTSATTGYQYIVRTNPGEGNVIFTEASETTVGQLYYGYSATTVYYEGKETHHRNSDWFSEFVLGDNAAYKDIDMDYKVLAASDVKVLDVEWADLIYISGTDEVYTSSGQDITPEVMLSIYNEEINYEHKAVMMDHALYTEDSDTNISKLAILLWQESADILLSIDADDESVQIFTTTTKKDLNGKDVTRNDIKSADVLTDKIYDTLRETMVESPSGNFVTGNVYVYNHHMADFKESKTMVDALDIFANGDFASAYTDDVVAQGFTSVINYITASNKNSMTGAMSTDVTPAVVIQYILVSDGQALTVMKNDLRVLEIQPVPAYLYNPGRGSVEYLDLDANKDATVIKNREDFVEDFLTAYYKDKIKYITFTSMTVSEFNGRNEDLVESYDIVYIGDEIVRGDDNLYYLTSRFNLRDSMVWDEKTNSYKVDKIRLSDFTDDMLDGNIYYNIGDIVDVFTTKGNRTARNNLYGYLDGQDYKNKLDAPYTKTTKVRFNGRDITKNKLSKLKDFLNAQGLVIVAEELLGQVNTTVEQAIPVVNPTKMKGNVLAVDCHGRVDSSSNMYEFLSYATATRFDAKNGGYRVRTTEPFEPMKNLVSAADIKRGLVGKADLNKYIAAEKLSLILMEAPTEYSYSSTNNAAGDVIIPESITYLSTKDSDGTRYLNYKFSIAAETTAGTGISYTPHLYVDINNDGKYSKTMEDVTDCIITDTNGVEADKDEASGRYVLFKDTVYVLRRDITDEYAGILKWKLDIQSNLSDSSHASAEGYTLVENETGNDKQVRILQITENNAGSTLDLAPQLNDYRNNGTPTTWGPYLDEIPGYELHIKTMTIEAFEDDFDRQYAAYLAEPGENKLGVEDYATKIYFPAFVVETAAEAGTTQPITGINMLVCGFGDDFESFESEQAVSAVKTFVENGNPVLMAHDFVSYAAAIQQDRALRQLVGMDLYGVSQNISIDNLGNILLVNRWNAEGEEQATNDSNLRGILHNNVGLTRSANGDDVRLIESIGKEVAYEPNSEREMVSQYKQGYSNFVIEWQKDYEKSPNSWINAEYGVNKTGNSKKNPGDRKFHNEAKSDFAKYEVLKLNDGQITEYPYRIPESFVVSTTHSQWYTLDLTSDADQDGESDVVVWYALGSSEHKDTKDMKNGTPNKGGNPYSDEIGGSVDPANGYFIFNKGNVTYTGAGHSDLNKAGKYEIQLFVNTLLAAFEVGKAAPKVKFYDSTDREDDPISAVVIPYDENVTKRDGNGAAGEPQVDSSVLKEENAADGYKYKFVDPNTQPNVKKTDGTKIYFRVTDTSLVRGDKSIEVKYYLKVNKNPGDVSTLNDGTTRTVDALDFGGSSSVNAVDISDKIVTYEIVNGVMSENVVGTNEEKAAVGLQSGEAYGIYLPMDYLNNEASFTIYVQAKTRITSVSTAGVEQETMTDLGYQSITITKADLLKLD